MTINKKLVSDSIELSAIKTDKFKTGIITFTLTLPLTQDFYLNSLLLTGILRRGTEKYPRMADINRRLDELYASSLDIRCNMLGDSLLIIFSGEFLDSRYVYSDDDIVAGIIEMVAQMLLFPNHSEDSFDEKVFEQEKKCVSDALRSEVNNTRVYAAIKCNELMNRDNTDYPTVDGLLGRLGEVSAKDVFKFYKNEVLNASIDVFYIGNETVDAIGEKILKEFDGFIGAESRRATTATEALTLEFISKTKSMPVSQGKLTMGFFAGVDVIDDNYYSALVLNEIFGGFASSKLFLNVREKMNICYYCSSSYSIYSGIMLVSAGIDSSNHRIAERAILDQLEEIKNGNISDDELSSAKKSLVNCYKQIYDNPLDIQSFHGGRALFGIEESVESCQEKIAAVTNESIVSIARDIKYIAEFFVEENLSEAQDDFAEDDDDR